MKWYFIWPPKFGRDDYFWDYPRNVLYLGIIAFEWEGDDWPLEGT